MSWFTPKTTTINNHYDRGKFILAWRLCLLFSFVFTVLTITFINSRIEEIIVYLACTIIALLALFYLAKTKKSKAIYYFLSITGTLIAMYTLHNFNQLIHHGDFLWMILIITFSFFGLGIKVGVIFLCINLSNIIYYALFTVNLNLTNLPLLSHTDKIALVIELFAATISISYVIYQFVVFHDYFHKNLIKANDDLKGRNKVILAQNQEKTTLVKEIHHRVKNNLQIVISLLRLQKNELKSDEAKRHFNEAINRIMVISLIHQKLYQEKELAKIEIESYLTDLAEDVIKISSLGIPMELKVNSEVNQIGLKTIVPLGLIINELLSNSVKHAFFQRTEGAISIHLSNKEDNNFLFVYSDDGQWVEPSKDDPSFGIELLGILSSQLEGSYERKLTEFGTTYSFDLKDMDLEM